MELIRSASLTQRLSGYLVAFMFSGIVSATGFILESFEKGALLYLKISRPKEFQKIALGDSIAVNGVCLTVEEFDSDSFRVCLGEETLKITGGKKVFFGELNLEMSLCFGEPIHGHLVSGHVDDICEVLEKYDSGDGVFCLELSLSEKNRPYICPKGSVALHGVSLTVNSVKDNSFCVSLIPETLKRTNLSSLVKGSYVNLEVDSFSRMMVHYFHTREGNYAKLS